MDTALDILSWAFLMAGCAFMFIGALGILRLPDVFARMHAAGIIDTLGLGLLIIGMGLQVGFNLVLVKLVMILAFVLYTSPTTTHALSRAIIHAGIKPLTKDSGDDHDMGNGYLGPTSLKNPTQAQSSDKAAKSKRGA